MVTITLSGDCGLKHQNLIDSIRDSGDNYLIRWLWIETLHRTMNLAYFQVTITLSGDCGLKRAILTFRNCVIWLWQLPYQVIVDWNDSPGYSGVSNISCDNYLIRWLWIETWFICFFEANFRKWQLPYQVIVDWNHRSYLCKNPLICDNYLIRWLWIETQKTMYWISNISGDNYLIRWLWIETEFNLSQQGIFCRVTITLSGDCGLKQGWHNSQDQNVSDNYLIRWLWIETHRFEVCCTWWCVTITLSGDCGLKLEASLPSLATENVTITLSGDCGLKRRAD